MNSTKKLNRRQVYGFVSERQDVEMDIGDWDMTNYFGILVPHGLTATESKTIKIESFWIRNDTDDTYYHNSPHISCNVNAANIELLRIVEDPFDSVDFDTATDYNRGKIFFSYIKKPMEQLSKLTKTIPAPTTDMLIRTIAFNQGAIVYDARVGNTPITWKNISNFDYLPYGIHS